MLPIFPDNMALNILSWLALLGLSLSIHESAHAWMADRQGDPGPKNAGRISLNPADHIDVMWSIVLPILLLVSSGGRFCFGGAKPVQVNPYAITPRGMMLVAIAGPISNFLQAAFGAIVLIALAPYISPEHLTGDRVWMKASPGYNIVVGWIVLNLVLGFFNMIPLPPLDGSRVVHYYVPVWRRHLEYMEMTGIGLILLLLLLQTPVARPMYNLIGDIVRPLIDWHFRLWRGAHFG